MARFQHLSSFGPIKANGSLLIVTGADTVKPTLNPFEKLSQQKVGIK